MSEYEKGTEMPEKERVAWRSALFPVVVYLAGMPVVMVKDSPMGGQLCPKRGRRWRSALPVVKNAGCENE